MCKFSAGIEVILLAEHVLMVVVEQIGQGRKCLRCGKGPTRSAPLATRIVDLEIRMTSFGHSRTKRRQKSLRISQLPPGLFVAASILGQVEIPGHVTENFAYFNQFARFAVFRGGICRIGSLVPSRAASL